MIIGRTSSEGGRNNMEKAGTYEDDEEQPPSSVKHKHAFSDFYTSPLG